MYTFMDAPAKSAFLSRRLGRRKLLIGKALRPKTPGENSLLRPLGTALVPLIDWMFLARRPGSPRKGAKKISIRAEPA